jgi:hypothetical protein
VGTYRGVLNPVYQPVHGQVRPSNHMVHYSTNWYFCLIQNPYLGKIGEIPLLLHFEFCLANAEIGGFITLHFRRTVFYFAPKFSPLLVNTYHYITVTLSSSSYHNFHVNIFQPPLPIKVSIFKYFTSEFLFYFSHPDI